ncbi:affinity nitrate transporter 2 [Seminavis robusta]|uniref:Nitrate/nitrite transporter n=1 Tax=Seminavis robusta TaxID=568900 RepID=A0A9N8HB02_9STRA|nr:affinity nitrate transporter 2 [Seminavis robusta]|eukprot:Sro317_g115720.1 affinity nitrate transporter 2 (510) ;mRNA; f:18451-20606
MAEEPTKTEEHMTLDVDEIADIDEPWMKYHEFACEVDPDQDYKSNEIKLCNFSRPHMRAFHCSWMGFFIAFFIWFAIAPLLSEIKDTLGLTKKEIWTSSIVGVAGTIAMRFILGPLCDKFGARVLMSGILCIASVPTACTGLINSAAGLAILRLFIGIAGGTFVMCQYWSSRMFTKNVVGTANALVGGWGNLGGGVTQLVMGSLLFPLFKEIFKNSEDPAEKAWRTVSIVPAVVAFGLGVTIFFVSDDAPTGNYAELKRRGAMPEISAAASFRSGALNLNTWILFVQYACCFGVELTMNNAAALYFKDEFGQSTESAAAIASIFGWMNLFARGIGGWGSDKANARLGMRGRLAVQTVLLLGEGLLVLLFANTGSLGLAIVVMVFFSLFVQAAEGSTYGIVPYVDPPSTGSIAGIVGAGGNTGAVCFGLGFRQLEYFDAFMLMGAVILASSVLSAGVFIKGQSSLFCGGSEQMTVEKANAQAGQTLMVPEPDVEIAAKMDLDDVIEEIEA